MTYEHTNGSNQDFVSLCHELDAYLNHIVGGEENRGRGISVKLMELLEQTAKEQGYSGLVLESGEILTEAMALYRKIGYEVIPNYGPYMDMCESVCMRKEL